MSLELDDNLDLDGAFAAAREAWTNELHTALPARVESYDRATQRADVRPMVRRSIPRVDGGRAVEEFPILRGVRIVWPRAGDWFVHMPLAAGDFLLVVCMERDFTRWAQTGDIGDPVDVRNHSLSFAVGIPGVYPRPRALGDAPADALVIGKDGGSTVRIGGDGVVTVKTSGAAAKKLVTENAGDHFSAISSSLDEIRGQLQGVVAALGGTVPPVPTADPHYGAVAKAALDASSPIAAQNARYQ